MDYKIQLLSFIVSFGFGICLNFINQVFLWYVKRKNIVIKYLLASFLALDISLLYIGLMYKINDGIVHIYFILVMFIGVYLGGKVKIVSIFKKLMKNNG